VNLRSASAVAQASDPRRQRLVALLLELTDRDGLHPSRLAGVKLARAAAGHPRTPVLYEPSLFIVANGRKTGFIGDRQIVYDPNNYLVLSAPLPFECRTDAAPDGPMLGLSVGVDLAVVGELAIHMASRPVPVSGDAAACVRATPLDAAMGDAVVRLLECLRTPVEAAILGPGIVREIVYRALCGPQGGLLLAMVGRQGQAAQIQAALRHLHLHYAEPFNVRTMAGDVGMSVSAFHHHFKAVTAASPVQYLKSIRLHKARLLIVNDGVGAAAAAAQVGYESPSQFSREFKRFFGSSPKEESRKLRGLLTAEPAAVVRTAARPM
jgi:AraC-like DNA-binding protein